MVNIFHCLYALRSFIVCIVCCNCSDCYLFAANKHWTKSLIPRWKIILTHFRQTLLFLFVLNIAGAEDHKHNCSTVFAVGYGMTEVGIAVAIVRRSATDLSADCIKYRIVCSILWCLYQEYAAKRWHMRINISTWHFSAGWRACLLAYWLVGWLVVPLAHPFFSSSVCDPSGCSFGIYSVHVLHIRSAKSCQ